MGPFQLRCLFVVTAIALTISPAQAQITPAGDGFGTRVTSTPGQFTIQGGSQVGSNLFHSFDQFGLQAGTRAVFESRPVIRNILATVAGGQPSLINGQLQVTGGVSNLYLMNPAGIIFGSGASLNLPASFTATTASAIGFGNGWFNASGSSSGSLVGDPQSFAFTMPQPGVIVNGATLAVTTGRDLTLLGGTVVSPGALVAPAGQITIAAVAGGQFVRLSQPGGILSVEIPTASLPAPTLWDGAIPTLPQLLTNPAIGSATGITINAAGQPVLTGSQLPIQSGDVVGRYLNTSTPTNRNAGAVNIYAQRDLTLTGEWLSIDTLSPLQAGGNVILNALGNISLNRIRARGNSQGGNIFITAGGNVTTANLFTGAEQGNGGSIRIWSGGDVVVGSLYPRSSPGDNNFIPPLGFFLSYLGRPSNSGSVSITARGNITTGAIVSTAEQGNGGSINLMASTGNITLTNTLFSGSLFGKAGDIFVQAGKNIDLTEAFAPAGVGQGGRVTLITGNQVTLRSGRLQENLARACGTTGVINCAPDGTVVLVPIGEILRNQIQASLTIPLPWPLRSYRLSLSTGQVRIIGNRATFTSEATPPVSVDDPRIGTPAFVGEGGSVSGQIGGDGTLGGIASAVGIGQAGDVNFTGRNLNLGDISTIAAAGNAGNVTLQANQQLQTDTIDASSLTAGKDGEVFLQADRLQTGAVFSDNILRIERGTGLVSVNEQVLQIEQERLEEFQLYFGDQSNLTPASVASMQATLRQVSQQTRLKPAIVYYKYYPKLAEYPLAPEELQIVLILPQGNPVIYRYPIAQSTFLRLIKNFRTEVKDAQTPARIYQKSARELYEVLLQPLEAALQTAGVTTLLFSLDSHLRSLPLAALYDGDRYLIEKYNFSLIPSIALTDTRYTGIQQNQVLAMGASEFPGTNQSQLPAVPLELDTITQQLWAGQRFLNQDLTRHNLAEYSRRSVFQIIHLATHARFASGRGRNSYIQLWGDRLYLDQLRELNWQRQPQKELLVLSACETAQGDQEAEMGFAGLAFRAGVKSVLASLWDSDDVGTLGLMAEFYHHLKQQPLKAQALQAAQVALLQGQLRLEQGQLRSQGAGLAISLPDGLGDSQTAPLTLSHPAYWAAFTLVGSPW